MNCRGSRQRFLSLPDLSRKIEGDSVRGGKNALTQLQSLQWQLSLSFYLYQSSHQSFETSEFSCDRKKGIPRSGLRHLVTTGAT